MTLPGGPVPNRRVRLRERVTDLVLPSVGAAAAPRAKFRPIAAAPVAGPAIPSPDAAGLAPIVSAASAPMGRSNS